VLGFLVKNRIKTPQYFAIAIYTTIISGSYAPLILAPAEGFSLEPCYVLARKWGMKILMGAYISRKKLLNLLFLIGLSEMYRKWLFVVA
jgi:hypothetical protein